MGFNADRQLVSYGVRYETRRVRRGAEVIFVRKLATSRVSTHKLSLELDLHPAYGHNIVGHSLRDSGICSSLE